MKVIWLVGSIDDAMARAVCVALSENTGQPICIVIACDGGNTDATQAILLAMRLHGDAHTFAVGEVASSGIDVLMHGKTRGAHGGVIGMTHGTRFETKDARYRQLHNQRDRAMVPWLEGRYSEIFSRKYKYWSARDLLDLGFVDYVADQPTISADANP